MARINPALPLFLAAMLAIGSACSAQPTPGPNPQPKWEPELPPPIQDPNEAFPQGSGSLLTFFSLKHYNLKKTTAKDAENLRIALIEKLDTYKEERKTFDLPARFAIRDSNPTDAFKTAETLLEYDQQILDAYQKIENQVSKNIGFQYHRIGITALNCLDYLSKGCEDGSLSYREAWDNFLYYGELAVWALTNEYVYSDLTTGGKVDLFYRIAQAYDHVGTATTNDDPPFRHELYFISSAFLELSFRSLESIDFSAEGHEYRSSVWILYMQMHFRMGKYVSECEGFFDMMEERAIIVSELNLSDKETNDVQICLNDLDEWRDLHG